MATTGDLAELFGCSPQTLRVWASTFKEFLSEDATGGGGAIRQFDEDDIRVLLLVNELRNEHKPYDEIKSILAAGARAELPEMDPPHQEQRAAPLAEVPIQELIRLTGEQRGEIKTLREERDHLREELREERTARTVAEKEASRLQGRLEALEHSTPNVQDVQLRDENLRAGDRLNSPPAPTLEGQVRKWYEFWKR